jgi:hypothetical protein
MMSPVPQAGQWCEANARLGVTSPAHGGIGQYQLVSEVQRSMRAEWSSAVKQ